MSNLKEKAVSKKQQQFMGIVRAIQKGEMTPEDATPDARAAAKSMKKKDVEDFAKTKHKGLPEKVPENIEEDTDEKICPETGKIVKRKHKGFPEKFPKNVEEKLGPPPRRLRGKWVSGEKYDRDNIPVGSTVKVNYGEFKGKSGKVYDEAPADGYSMVKVGSHKEYYHNSDLLVRENKNINEIKSDMIKDGLRYAKKKYKYNTTDMKELAKDTLTYIKSGEIDDQPGMEAYIDFRHDEKMVGEIKEVIRGVVKEILKENK